MHSAAFTVADAPFAEVYRLTSELGLDSLAAQTLVRRGLSDPQDARRFLAADEEHDPSAFRGIELACEAIERHAQRGSPILVHGDYDADGVCSTAILVSTLRAMGAEVRWFIPGRREDGYGLSRATIERAAESGVGLIVTADCGITSVDEVHAAREAGIDVVVTDHHRPRADGALPDCPIVHPVVSGYPFGELCAAAVAHKLAVELRRRNGLGDPEHGDLDLVAIATIADCVPLVGENRRLVAEGLIQLGQTGRPGLRALMRVSQADPSAVDEQTVGFRLAPRLNAAGRVERADGAVELLLSDDPEIAERCALELDRLNAERRHIETRIRFEAESQIAAAGPQPGYVLASPDWHPGVIGISASRLSERHGRPVVLVALDGESGTGSGRSIPGFNLLAALDRCAGTLERHGGHAAAAGCTVATDRLEEFRSAFVDICREVLGDEPPVPELAIDAVAAPGAMNLDSAGALQALAPFGAGHERPRILLRGVSAESGRAMGEGRHIRCTLRAGGRRASAVAFGTPALPGFADEPVDVACTLEVNRWKGREEPRVLIEAMAPASLGPARVVGEPDDDAQALAETILEFGSGEPPTELPEGARRVMDRQDEDPLAVIAALAAGGAPVAVVTRDAHRLRRRLGGMAVGACLASWGAWRSEHSLLDGFEHVVVVDPPLGPRDRALLETGGEGQFSHLAWGQAELRSTLDELQREHDLRAAMVAVYRAATLRPDAPASEILLAGDPERPAELAALIANVFAELGIAELAADGRLVMQEGASADLERSELGRRHAESVEERLRWLSAPRSLAA